MPTIHRTVEIPPDRRLNLNWELPEELPPGPAELHLIVSPPIPARGADRGALADYAGCLKDDPGFAGDAVEIQRKMRDEW